MANVGGTLPITAGTVNASITPPAGGTIVKTVTETTGVHNVAVGALRVTVLNMGFQEAGDLEVDASVDGVDLAPGAPPLVFTAALDAANEIFKTLPAISINGNGARVRIVEER